MNNEIKKLKRIYFFEESEEIPAYIDVGLFEEDGIFFPIITVRGNGSGAGTGEIELTQDQALDLAHKLIRDFA